MAAVYAFNRVARAIDAILAHLAVPCANYVDDYPIVTERRIARGTVCAAKSVLEILGWGVKEPDELLPTSQFKALGIYVELSGGPADRVIRVMRVPGSRKRLPEAS